MSGRLSLRAALFCVVVSLFMLPLCSLPAQAQLVGTDTMPGAACDREGSVRMTANAAGPGAYILTCDGSAWRATMNAELPTANEQVATKEYVDSALAAGGPVRAGYIADCNPGDGGIIRYVSAGDPRWEYCDGNDWLPFEHAGAGGNTSGPTDCPEIGDVCTGRGNIIFAGWHPITHKYLFIPPADQGTTSAWKTSTGVNDIVPSSFSDGRANSDQVPDDTAFPAFKQCKDLVFGGHDDWYLPSRGELDYLYNIRADLVSKGNIVNFQNVRYWSSSQYNAASAWRLDFSTGSLNDNAKTDSNRVRCVRM